jgi:DNA-binding FadR family transcriptional regulator
VASVSTKGVIKASILKVGTAAFDAAPHKTSRKSRTGGKISSETHGLFQAPMPILRNVHTQVADHLGTSIVRGDIAPGKVLPSELRICELLEVSRTVVREAIRMLAGKGLVESRAKRGTRVRSPEEWNQLDPDVLRWQLETTDVNIYLAKLFQLRNAVEPAAAEIAAVAARADDLDRLRKAFDDMVAARHNEAFVVADIAFHKGIYIATRNEFFWPIAQMFEITLRRSFTIAADGDHRPRGLIEHREVLDAIARRDPTEARQKTVLLLSNSATDLVRIRGIDPFVATPPG